MTRTTVRRQYRLFVGCLVLSGLLFGCASLENRYAPFAPEPTYEPRMTIDAPASLALCGSIGGDPQSDSDITAVRVQLVNGTSGQPIVGSAQVTYPGRSTGSVGNDSYTCEQVTGSTDVFIAAYAPGLSPTGFGYSLPAGQRVTFTIPLQESCSGAPSCYDIARKHGGVVDEANARESVASDLASTFNITDYTLSCIECSLTRGGFVRAQGTLANGTAFAAYVRHGWCSSGGTDCGSTTCYVEAATTAALPTTCTNPPIVVQPSGRP